MSENVVMIDIDELGIDAFNIRGGEWDYDSELIQSIRENGIIDPLIVRPAAPETGVKYAIICGSRRFNAAIEVGLTKVPALIKEVDDVTAAGISIMENKHRKDIPGWKYALTIGEMFERLNHHGNRAEVVKLLMSKTGLSDASIYNYLDIAGLPNEIIELMKEPEKRSETVKELLKGSQLLGAEKTLSIDKAAILARELKGYPIDKVFEVATVAMSIPVEKIREFVEQVKVYPRMSAWEVYTQKVLEIPKGRIFSFEFNSYLVRAIDEACLRKQMDRKLLITRYVEEGLKRDGFI